MAGAMRGALLAFCLPWAEGFGGLSYLRRPTQEAANLGASVEQQFRGRDQVATLPPSSTHLPRPPWPGLVRTVVHLRRSPDLLPLRP